MLRSARMLFRAAQVRELDRIAIEELGIPGMTLMQRAGSALYRAMRSRWPRARRVLVLCGPGNNGGDGFVAAELAHRDGLEVQVLLLADPQRLKGDALTAYNSMCACGLQAKAFDSRLVPGAQHVDVIVDAMLGTGLSGDIKGPFAEAVRVCHDLHKQEDYHGNSTKIIAADIPSGLHADRGVVLGDCVPADVTVTFIGMKQGLLTAQGPDFCGELLFDDLDVPKETYSSLPAGVTTIEYSDFKQALSQRRAQDHKHRYGRVLIIGGNFGMAGALALSCEAALRAGAGLVSAYTRQDHVPIVLARRAEVMCHGDERGNLSELLSAATVVAIGPGLGLDQWAQNIWQQVLSGDKPVVVDADALNLLAQQPCQRDNWILTPHSGEAARLLGVKSDAVQQDRFAAMQDLLDQYGGTVVLKGCGSLVASAHGGGSMHMCTYGNPGMSSAGMGDVLTGVIAGLWAQGMSQQQAAAAAVLVHARAADELLQAQPRGLLAGDLLTAIRSQVNRLI